MPNLTLKQQASNQAVYMNYISQKAQEMAAHKKILNFDPQGRFLIEVTLENKDYQQLSLLGLKVTNKAELEKNIGRVTNTTIVSLDITGNKALENRFNTQLSHAFDELDKKNYGVLNMLVNQVPHLPGRKYIDALTRLANKGSIIALQQEFHFHLALFGRVYQKVKPELGSKFFLAQEATLNRVNKLVTKVFANALKSSLDIAGEIDISNLNKALDKGRAELFPQAHQILRQELIRHTGIILTKKDLLKVDLKHLASETTASPNDVIHIDKAQHLVTLITGSDNTAHNRIAGSHFAHRQLISSGINSEGIIRVSKNPRIQIRTPSPVVKDKKEFKEEQENNLQDYDYFVRDVAIKLTTIKNEYNLSNTLTTPPKSEIPASFIYNSHTALNHTLGDVGGNLQTQSARHILLGAHQYNQQQLSQQAPVFCLVQNISVNGFGDKLNLNSRNALVKESTLMAEMAMLHTLYSTITDKYHKKAINDIFTQYKLYLSPSELDKEKKMQPEYFSQSKEGAKAIERISSLKIEWK
jgi:hypothetical protein